MASPKDDIRTEAVTKDQTTTCLTKRTDESFLSPKDDLHFGQSVSKCDLVEVSSCRSSSRSAGRLEVGCSVQEVSSPGCYGAVTVEHSREVHFGNKIYTAPVTVVNHLGCPDDVKLKACKDPFERPAGLHWPRKVSIDTRWSKLTRGFSRVPCCCPSRRKAVVVTIIVIVIITVCAALATAMMFLGSLSSSTESVTDDILINASWFYIRSDWQANPPKRVTHQNHPVPYVIVLHTAYNTCTTHRECVNVLKAIQDEHMFNDHSWDDIAYNYMIGGGPKGGVYMGRGTNAVGAHAGAYNPVSLGVAFIGDYNAIVPSDAQMRHLAALIKMAVRQNKLKKHYQVLAHCQISNTLSPGKFLMEEVRKMPHWNKSSDCSL